MGYNTGTIVDGGVSDVNILNGRGYVGGFAGYNTGSIMGSLTIGISKLNGTSNNVGGFLGYSTGKVTQSYATNNVNGSSYVGGFVGYMGGGAMEQCFATGNVNGTSNLGGFVGYLSNGSSLIKNGFSTGNVAAGSNSAGFVGNLASGKVENCYSLSNNANGFNGNGTVTNCYFDSSLLCIPTTKAEARTTEQMMKASNYAGWDFEHVWEIRDDEDYPILTGLEKPNMLKN